MPYTDHTLPEHLVLNHYELSIPIYVHLQSILSLQIHYKAIMSHLLLLTFHLHSTLSFKIDIKSCQFRNAFLCSLQSIFFYATSISSHYELAITIYMLLQRMFPRKSCLSSHYGLCITISINFAELFNSANSQSNQYEVCIAVYLTFIEHSL